MADFIEERLLDAVAYGSEFGHSYNTLIKTLQSGVERRKARWSVPRHRGAVLYRNLAPADHALVIATHHACLGASIGFRFKDWSDFVADDELIGTGTGAPQTLQLRKNYVFGTTTRERPIQKPVAGTVTVYVDGTPAAPTVDTTTGEVTITAADGAAITWSGEFDVPVRFEADEISFTADNRNADGLILTADVGIIEIRV